MTRYKLFAQTAFLVAGFLTVLEFVFVRGMFTWLIAAALTIVLGLVNVVLCCRDREWMPGVLYILAGVALTMGYFVLA
jgi:hypothetical protein